ncbi:MAG: M1 family metallopeptidase [Flavobacterium sp.]
MKYILLIFSAIAFGQQTKSVDFLTANGNVLVDFDSKSINGNVSYTFNVLQKIDTIKIDAISMEFSEVKINGKKVGFVQNKRNLALYEGFKKGKNSVTFTYKAVPKQALYFNGIGEDRKIWTQGQGKYTSHWFPSFDDVNEKMIFGLAISTKDDFAILSNGILQQRIEEDGLYTVKYQMSKPMSSYLLALVIGNFKKTVEKSNSGISIENYLSAEDSDKYSSTYANSKQIFDFLEKEIGVRYPWEIYRQVPIKDFLYGGMENTTLTTFTQDYVVDKVGHNDKNYDNVSAHELAHQWFGDYVTADSGEHHWLQEGFATYYALLAEKDIYGDDYFNWELYEMAERLKIASAKDTIPLMNPSASALTFYQKGAWALHILKREVGDVNFAKAVKNYLTNYAFSNVKTDDFLAEIRKVSSYDTEKFKREWLQSSGFDSQKAIAILKENAFMQQYFDMLAKTEIPFEEKKKDHLEILKSEANPYIKEEILMQLTAIPFEDKKQFLEVAMQSKNLKVRQAVAKSLDKIPTSFYEEYLTLLDDESYITQEIALNMLWSQFAEKRVDLLEKTKGRIGFNDRNLEIQWLTLALITPNFEEANKAAFYDRLVTLSKSPYESPVRMNAITNLLYLNKNDTNVLKLLVEPLLHHKWQFQKFARDKIRSLSKEEKFKTFFNSLLPDLPLAEAKELERVLN